VQAPEPASCSHGIAAVATGGSIVSIEISPNQGGLCTSRGGLRFVISTAGYLGSLLWGVGLLLVVGTRRIWQLVTLVTLGVLVMTVSLLYIRAGLDASILADLTGVPTVLWGLLWIGISVAVCWWLLRRTFRKSW
jgi:hypothetical protein